MCGIAACYNVDNAPEIATRILLGQDDRGRDATGVAYIKDGNIELIKKAIEPVKFYNEYCPKDKTSIIAIAHNRSASSNKKDKNKDSEAHPFLSEDGKVTICHNGTIINDDTLRDFLTTVLGHKFESEVDSEVYVHMLEEAMKNSTTRNEAIKRMFNSIVGNILILFNDGTLYGIPNTSYFIVAISGNQGYIASEISALKDILPKKEQVTLFKRDYKKNDQLVKFNIDDKNTTTMELFGAWNEVEAIGDWIPEGEIRCDFCSSVKWCEKYLYNNISYDRCFECYNSKKTVPLSQKRILNNRRTSIDSVDCSSLCKNTSLICEGCKHEVTFDDTYYCPLCNRLMCKSCFFSDKYHKCRTAYSVVDQINLCFPTDVKGSMHKGGIV